MERALARFREEDGFSLTELLVAMSIGMIVLFAMLQIFIGGLSNSLAVSDRVESSQRARLAMDRVTTLLNSQVCIDSTRVPIVAGSDSSVTFYADLGDATFTPRQYRVTHDPTAKTLTEAQFDGTGTAPTITFPAAPTSTRVLATNIVPEQISATDQPIFKYYKYNSDGTMNPTPLATPLSAADAKLVVRIAVGFQVQPDRTSKPDHSPIQGQAIAGSADSADPSSGANCS